MMENPLKEGKVGFVQGLPGSRGLLDPEEMSLWVAASPLEHRGSHKLLLFLFLLEGQGP